MRKEKSTVILDQKKFEEIFLEKKISLSPDTINSKVFSNYLVSNLLLLKFAKIATDIDYSLNKNLSSLILQEASRVSSIEKRIKHITEFLNQDGRKHIFTKAFQHYPDMGHDIDLLLDDVITDKLKTSLNLKDDETSFLNEIAEKKPFILEDNTPIEFHRYIGHFGEYKELTRIFIENSVSRNGIRVLRREDQLILQVIQRLYSHFSIRFSDILLSIKILNSEIDLSYVRETTQKNNLYSSLVIFVNFINRNYGEYISNRDISLIVSSHNSVMPKRSGHIYKYSKLFAINLYIKQLFYALIHLDLFTLKKIVYLPFIFFVSEYKNLRNRQ
tara:strand:- start:82 stop:1071 length:990 start_codon:yes stop_codon:yes gene_type:complete